jgi:hypothetical protein
VICVPGVVMCNVTAVTSKIESDWNRTTKPGKKTEKKKHREMWPKLQVLPVIHMKGVPVNS